MVPFGTAAAAGALLAVGCAGAPWFLGEPLDKRPVIPPTSRAETVADHRRKLDDAQQRGEKVVELAELSALEQRGALRVLETKRFSALLRERAKDWIALRRPLPLVDDLRHILALEPERTRSLAVAVRSAERAAGDLWLALGENARAEDEYRRAARLGAPNTLFRLRAAWGASPADLETDVLERALAELPDRALGPFTAAYLDGGGSQPPLLARAWRAARVYGPPELQTRIEAVAGPGMFTPDEGLKPNPDVGGAGRDPQQPLAVSAPATLAEPGAGDRLYGGATLVRSLLPLAEAFPGLLAPGPRSRDWSDRLLAEDPTSPDSLELAALIDAQAGRIEGAARKLGDLVFYSPDRATGNARAAHVWERVGAGRRACLAWERATHFGPADDPRWCDLAACLRRNPGAGDALAVERFARERTPAPRCVSADAGAPSTDAAVPVPIDAAVPADAVGAGAALLGGPDGGAPDGT
jgi:hypothetical protein